MRVFLNLCAGLDRLGIDYRVNDYRYLRRRAHQVACVVGKPHVLDVREWDNPILFGASLFSHPSDDPSLLTRRPVRRVLVPGEWMRRMFEPYYGAAVHAWPVGIDTYAWTPTSPMHKDIDVLLYDKVRWERERLVPELIAPVQAALGRRGLRVGSVRYGYYREEEFKSLVARARAMVFLCEHETQGIAYQQVLACDVPILAWDRGGPWKDPSYYPNRANFGPVTSVPYWDDRCGRRFASVNEFETALDEFWDLVNHNAFAPRQYIESHLTLERCARDYLSHVAAVAGHAQISLAS
jgi:hypothetical protein